MPTISFCLETLTGALVYEGADRSIRAGTGAPVKHARYGPNTVVTWPLQRAAPFFAKILTTSTTGDERAWAAMALSGSGDRVYLPVLRRVAAEDGQARALAYNGIMYMLGPDALGDLRLARGGPLLS